MLSKNKIKFVHSLSRKRERDESSLFVAEGDKMVRDLLPYCRCRLLIATPDFLKEVDVDGIADVVDASQSEIEQVSLMRSPQSVVGVFEKPAYKLDLERLKDKLVLALDTVQDPGNLGTIVRLADWFGISDVVCSMETADVYSPKVVQATMGAIARVKVHYVDLPSVLGEVSGSLPIYGTFLDGENIYASTLSRQGIVVMGNEGNGISAMVERCVNQRITIPNYGAGDFGRSESLNVAVATAVVCSEFRRRMYV